MKLFPTRAAVFLIAAACASVATARGPRDDAPVKPAAADVKLSPEQMKRMDGRFLKATYSANMLLIKKSEYVVEQSTDPKVKELAEMLVKHHTECKSGLEKIAAECNCELPKELSAVDKAKLEEFKELRGDMVAGPYLFDLAGDYVTAILATSGEGKSTENAAIKGYCEKDLPVVKKNLAAVKPLAEAKAKLTGGW